MRRAPTLALLVLTALLVAACSSSTGPGWTFSPETPPPASQAPASEAPSTAPSVAPSGQPSAAPSGEPSGDVVVLTAVNVQWVQKELSGPAGAKFVIRLENNDPNIIHNVEIKQNGQTVYKGDIFPGVETRDFEVGPFEAGTYEYICTVHPNMVGTLTIGG